MVIGIRIEKRQRGINHMNRYWVQAPTLEAAMVTGERIALIERTFHSTLVQFLNVHAWQPNQTPNTFRNLPLAFTGLAPAGNPLMPEIVARMQFAAENSYANRKDYRVAVQVADFLGSLWSPNYLGVLSDASEQFNDLVGSGVIVGKLGQPLFGPVVRQEAFTRQLSPRWYNKAGGSV